MEGYGRCARWLVAWGLVLSLSAAVPAKIIYVDDDAAGMNDGSSWANAFVRLQAAVYVAREGDEIRVAQGLYKPDTTSTTATRRSPGIAVDPRNVRYSAFPLVADVAIRGGYAGSGAEDPNGRDWDRYETILSGDLNGDDPIASGSGLLVQRSLLEDNCANVVESSGYIMGPETILDGFTIEGATQNALYGLRGSPQIVNCTFRRNVNLRGSGSVVYWSTGQPEFINCVFEDNAAVVSGGAIYLWRSEGTFTDCRFAHNWAMNLGGAIYSTEGVPTLTGCTFTENAGLQGGAIHCVQGRLTLVECRFEGNMAGQQGGAVNLAQVNSASMTRCVFVGNWTPFFGGAVIDEGASVFLDACTFSRNQAASGGAMYSHGLSPLTLDPPTLGAVMTNCLFVGNDASDAGGALWAYWSNLTANNCTFASNRASHAGTLAWPAIWAEEIVCRVAMENCIVWDGKGSIARENSLVRRSPQDLADAEVVIRYSNVQGGWSGEGNIDGDPLFAALGYWASASDPNLVATPDQSDGVWVEGDYHLKSQAGRWDPTSESWVVDDVTSPCIDAGDPNASVADEPQPNGGRINMGAYGGTAQASKSP